MTKEQFQKHCELQALWWIAYATTGAAKERKIFHKGPNMENIPFTDDEKISDALGIAQNHIRLFRESCET